MYKFRDIHQLTHQLFSIEDIISGNYIPCKDDWGCNIFLENAQRISEAYEKQDKKMICLFDRDNYSDRETDDINNKLKNTFEQFLHEKSMFEL